MFKIKSFFILCIMLTVFNSCPNGIQETVDAKGQSQVDVSISGSAFNPASLTVSVGATVTWKNQDGIHHTVTSSGNFDSGEILNGGSYSRKFETAGTFSYLCSYHPSMTGQITTE